MKTTPMLFSRDMVRALIDGRRTQTRRVCKLPRNYAQIDFVGGRGDWNDPTAWGFECPDTGHWALKGDGEDVKEIPCPYGQPGDLIWVRETFADLRGTGIEGTDPTARNDAAYSADVTPGGASDEARIDFGIKWKPSIHMPRWASRLTLRITDVRVERVQDISDGDQLAEGVPLWFRDLWDSLNAKRGYGWSANPWVWALTFTVYQQNVDTLARHLQAQRNRKEFEEQFAGMCS